ncbi:MAG: sigma-54-dependent Fis family transcriptional regulator [Acidobacteriales bacterium]|nr:sigma-54-dependent Fis family transcriptional regulator [Terriglobales bacterium]
MLPQLRTDLLNVLIVDDERAIRDGCREVAEQMGFNTWTAENATVAYRCLESHGIDIVVLDMKLPGASGQEVLQTVRQRRPETLVIVVTAYATVPSAVNAMKAGAFEYLTKPFHLEELRLLLQRAGREVKLAAESRNLRELVKSQTGSGILVGRSPEMEKLNRIVHKVAHSNHPVLILGESGTGKELVARQIHFSGPHRDKPFIPVDCGSLVPTLIESELFGYVKRAFTGAMRAKEGLLQLAEGGTVFLDEIGELPFDLQAKLLRALQEKEIRPVGGTKRVPIKVRIVAATNRDLEEAVRQGTFRKDLYFRLNVVNLRIPPLRERRSDIPVLAGHFLERMRQASGVERSFSDEALKLMMSYDWPGNVRELENCVDRIGALTSGPVVHVADLPTQLQSFSQRHHGGLSAQESVVSIAEMERQAIYRALDKTGGDKLQAAKLLGIGKTTLYRKLKEYGQSESGGEL